MKTSIFRVTYDFILLQKETAMISHSSDILNTKQCPDNDTFFKTGKALYLLIPSTNISLETVLQKKLYRWA